MEPARTATANVTATRPETKFAFLRMISLITNCQTLIVGSPAQSSGLKGSKTQRLVASPSCFYRHQHRQGHEHQAGRPGQVQHVAHKRVRATGSGACAGAPVGTGPAALPCDRRQLAHGCPVVPGQACRSPPRLPRPSSPGRKPLSPVKGNSGSSTILPPKGRDQSAEISRSVPGFWALISQEHQSIIDWQASSMVFS